MKVDNSKTNDSNRRVEPARSSSSENSVYQTLKNSETPPPNNGAFAKILEEARKNSSKDHELNTKSEKERAPSNSKSGEKGKTEDSTQTVRHDETVEEREKHKGGSSGEKDENGESEQNAFAALGFLYENRAGKENAAPAARSILHVADLERIIAAVRAQNLESSRSLTLTLKNSVLEGLRIKITIDANGKYKAEFLAGSEQIKKQIEARKSELAQIFSERGLNLTGLDVRQNSDFSKRGQTGENEKNSPENMTATGISQEQEPLIDEGAETSYRV